MPAAKSFAWLPMSRWNSTVSPVEQGPKSTRTAPKHDLQTVKNGDEEGVKLVDLADDLLCSNVNTILIVAPHLPPGT